VTDKNVKQLRILNNKVLPVQYQDGFYINVIRQPRELTKLLYYNDIMVGAICLKSEEYEIDNNFRQLYVMTLSVLESYRRMGLGSKLLNYAIDLATNDKTIKQIYLHVWVKNELAIAFYKKFDFIIEKDEPEYYTSIEPRGAHLVSRKFNQESQPPPSEQQNSNEQVSNNIVQQ